MTPFEDRLRAQLLSGLPAHRRRRRQRGVAGGALALALVAVLAGVALARDDGGAERAVAGPSSSASSTTTTAPTSSWTTGTSFPTQAAYPVPGGPALDPDDAARAEELVLEFLRRVRGDDLDGAAELWTGYPDALDGDPASVREAVVGWSRSQGLLADRVHDVVVTPAWSHPDHPAAVVTVVADSPLGGRLAGAFLVARLDDPLIARLATDAVPTSPARGQVLLANRNVVFAATPVEGAARAFVGDVEVPVHYDVDARDALVVEVPPEVTGEAVITLSIATPEVTDVTAAWFPLQG